MTRRTEMFSSNNIKVRLGGLCPLSETKLPPEVPRLSWDASKLILKNLPLLILATRSSFVLQLLWLLSPLHCRKWDLDLQTNRQEPGKRNLSRSESGGTQPGRPRDGWAEPTEPAAGKASQAPQPDHSAVHDLSISYSYCDIQPLNWLFLCYGSLIDLNV